MTQTRRSFLSAGAAGMLAMQTLAADETPKAKIPGFDQTRTEIDPDAPWKPVSDRKIKMGLVGYGVCKFGAEFGLQHHPNVELVAVSDLMPDRCAEFAKVTKCAKTYPSLEEMLKDKEIEAIYVATDAPSHARHCIDVLNHGKHVATAVPAVWGNLEDAEKLLETVKKSGLVYMMFETSVYHDDLYAMRKIYKAGGFGEILYSEGEYIHPYNYARRGVPIGSYKEWRRGSPKMFYPTHATAYYVGVTDDGFTEVSCRGVLSNGRAVPEPNAYGNKFGIETALLTTGKGGTSRMIVSSDIQGVYAEAGRVYGEKASYAGRFSGVKEAQEIVSKLKLKKPQLPPGVEPGGHGGSHGYLGNEFVEAILQNRRPVVDVIAALNMTVPGVVAHQSALKDGELMKIPQFTF